MVIDLHVFRVAVDEQLRLAYARAVRGKEILSGPDSFVECFGLMKIRGPDFVREQDRVSKTDCAVSGIDHDLRAELEALSVEDDATCFRCDRKSCDAECHN